MGPLPQLRGVTGKLGNVLALVQSIVQRLALGFFAFLAVSLVGATGLSAFGALPWLEIAVQWNGNPVPLAGMYAQISLTVLAIALCVFLPGNARVMALETSHRNFRLGMEDITRAYDAVHEADRAGLFGLESEFDSVRERLTHLRQHPDLADLEPDVLEVAAQMSHISRELAEVYSDDKVDRARTFLRQREEEIDRFNARFAHAKAVHDELRHWSHEVDLAETVVEAKLEQLRKELRDILEELGPQTFRSRHRRTNVVALPPHAAE